MRKSQSQEYRELALSHSTYHLYRAAYWALRGKWRNILYDWTRCEPCDATATLSPTRAVAGVEQTVTLTVTIGATALPSGGRIAVYFPIYYGSQQLSTSPQCFQGPDGETGYGARITAKSLRPDVSVNVVVHSTGSVFTCAEITVEEGQLVEDDVIEVTIGDPSCKPPVISRSAKTFPLRVAIDYNGDGSFRPVTPLPSVRVVGNRARYLRCFAPATPPAGEPFEVRVVAADLEGHNPSWSYEGRVSLTPVEGQVAGSEVAEIGSECHGTASVEGISVVIPGVSRIQVLDEANGLLGQTNPICPEAAPDGMALYYGEIHSHTELSDGGGTPEDSYRWARDVEGLDFAGLADHFEDGQSYNYTLEDKWRITREVTEQFDDPGRFVSLLGYEIGTLDRHRNVYFRDGQGRMIVEGRDGEGVTMDNVFEKLAGSDYILIPHAPKFHGIGWDRPHDAERQRLIEICSNWGISEEGGPLSVRAGLDYGYKFGFTGGTDNHQAEAGNPALGGITGVYAESLTREAIFDALMARRTFATSGPRMILTFRVNGALMGTELHATGEPRRVTGRCITCDAIDEVEVIRNGEVVHAVSGGGVRDRRFECEDVEELDRLLLERPLDGERSAYYYLRVTTVNGDIGWSSPIWLLPPAEQAHQR